MFLPVQVDVPLVQPISRSPELMTKGPPTLDNAPQLAIGTIHQDVLQLVERKWLGQMEIETGRQCPRLVGIGGIARERYEHDAVECAIQANGSCNFEAVHFRHAHIDDCNLGGISDISRMAPRPLSDVVTS